MRKTGKSLTTTELMKQSDLIALIGLPSNDPKLIAFFEKYQLGKIPKTITTNQGTKSVLYKPLNLSFWFKYDIKNERFQPPVSPTGDNYKFLPYLKSVMFNHVDDTVKTPDPKPKDFWDLIPHPRESYQKVADLMGQPAEKMDTQTTFEMTIGADTLLTVQYNQDNKGTLKSSTWVSIIEQSEIVSAVFFDPKYQQEDFPFKRRAYSAIIKWLYNKGWLLLQEQEYGQQLNSEAALLDFIGMKLKGHLWANQIADIKYLRSFLYTICSNRSIRDKHGNKISFYIRDIVLECMGKKNEFDILYKGPFEHIDLFLNELIFDDQIYEKIAANLTARYEIFNLLQA